MKIAQTPYEHDEAISLSADPGGDLYFQIYNNNSLQLAEYCQEYTDLSKIITIDSSETILRLGITSIRFYNLVALAKLL